MIIFDNVKKELKQTRAHGIVGFISFHRLESVLREAGELRERETVTQFYVDTRGIEFVVERK